MADAIATALGIVSSYESVSAEIAERLAVAVNETAPSRQTRQLEVLSRLVDRRTSELDAEATTWTENGLHAVLAAGIAEAARELGEDVPDGADVDLPVLAATALLALHGATANARRQASRLAQSRGDDRERLLLGTSSAITNPRLRVELSRGAIGVVYRNGARHTLGDYADSAVRAIVTKTKNTGIVRLARLFGVRWFLLRDGAKCGLRSHDDPEKANGMTVLGEVALAFPLAHPRCVRSVRPVRVLDQAQDVLEPFDSVADDVPTRSRQRRLARLGARASRRSGSRLNG